jgi:gliding motility-associated lipoprotein GldD
MKMNELFSLGILLFLSSACSQDYSPKPRAYFHIDLPEPVYHPVDFAGYLTFEVSNKVRVEQVKDSTDTHLFNLKYSDYNAMIYCTYHRISPQNLASVSDESRRMAYFHAIKTNGITEHIFQNPERNVFGTVYEIGGNVASPVQFVLTDSVQSFFRGALYFDHSPNPDSIAPVLAYINNDIQMILESFRWKQ